MKGEIDKDFYCAIDCFCKDFPEETDYQCKSDGGERVCLKNNCAAYHRKYPTPEQFKEEYGEEWEGACYLLVYTGTVLSDDGREWLVFANRHEKIRNPKGLVEDTPYVCACTVCACTPFGKPDKDWRP